MREAMGNDSIVPVYSEMERWSQGVKIERQLMVWRTSRYKYEILAPPSPP